MSVAELERWLASLVAERCGFPLEEIETDRALVDYGLSSRDAVELAGRLEDLLERALPSTLLWDHPTIQGIASALLAEETRRPARRRAKAAGREPVAVVGLGCRLPGDITGPEDFWRLLEGGEDAVGALPAQRWPKVESAADAEVLERTTRAGGFLSDIAGFDADFFAISPREAQWMDPQQRMMLEVGWEALEHAGISPESLRGSVTGVFVGVSASEYGHRSLSDLSGVDAWSGTGGALSVAANRLSYALDLRGPSVAVDAACSSSLVAVHLGMQSLSSGESDLIIAAGTNLLLGPAVTAAFHEMGVISPTGRCQPFSASADGIVRAEGAGVVVLKRLSEALRDEDRIFAVLRGSAINQDGRSNGITAPNAEAQEDLLRLAYDAAELDPHDIDYIEAHGTGTLLGDPIEARALSAVLGSGRAGSRPLLIGSAKSNLGHLEAAAGIVGLIKLVLSLSQGRIPASLHYTGGHPHIDFAGLGLAVVDRPTDWPAADRPARAGVSAFGFGGTNAHVVVEQAPPPPASDAAADRDRIRRFLLAGPDATRVRDHAEALADWLDEGDGSTARICDVELTLARRLSGRARAAVVARDRESLIAGLRTCAEGGRAPNVVEGRSGRADAAPVWVFSGQGSQWAGMGLRLMRDEPEFATALGELDGLVHDEAGFSVCEVLERGEELTAMERLQPVLFAVQVALSRLLTAHGVTPAAVVGHSLGEVAAAVAVGALTARDGARVVALRSRLLATLTGTGAMALLELSADELAEMLRDYPAVEVAAYNAPTQVAVAGEPAQITQLVASLERGGRLAKPIKSAVAGHCRLVDPVVGALADGLRALEPREPHTPLYGTVLDDPRAIPAFDADYWAANIRQPVRFAHAIAASAADGHESFVEVSPHAVLSHALTESARGGGVERPLVLGTGRRCEDETSHFHAQLTALMLNGGALPRPASDGARLIDLPRTRWRHSRHWLEPQTRRAPIAAHPLLGERIELPGIPRPMWQSELDAVDPAIAGADRWVALSTWLEIVRSAATEALRPNSGAMVIRDLVLHEPRALGDRCTLNTSIQLTTPRTGQLTVHSRIGRGAWRVHLSATVEMAADPSVAAPADPDASIQVVLAAKQPAERGTRSTAPVVEQALEALVDVLGLVGQGLWLPRSVGHARWLGELDDVVLARICSSHATATGELTTTLQLTDEEGHVRLELGAVTLRHVSPAELPVALPEKLLRLEWHTVKAPRAPIVRGRWLVVGDSSNPRAEELADGLRSRGAEAHVVDGSAAAETLRGDPTVDGVVILVAPSALDEDPELAPSHGEALVLDGATIVRALSERPSVGATRTRLHFATTGASAVTDGDQPDPGPAALRGLVRVLAYEHPELQATWVDLEPGRGVDDLLRELGATDAEDEVAWRAGRRYVARLVRPEPAEITAKLARTVRSDGAYLISGGLGGLGLVLARWLAESGAARIVLNGRSAPSPRVLTALAQLRELGSEVIVVNGDIADPGVAEQAVAACTAAGARLRGVIHAAAVIEDRVTSRLDADSLHRVWSAKAAGGWRLSEATSGLELDWWVGFSSAAALIGSPGQAAYAAANAYLDAITAGRRARGMVASTINWGTWSEVGRAADRGVDAVSPITPVEGLEALEALLAAEMPAAGVVKLDPSALAESFPDLRDIPLLSRLFGSADTPGERASIVWSEVAALDPARAHALIEARVNDRISAVLGVGSGRLDADAPLTTLGLDSLLAVRIRNAVQHDFDVLLPPSLLLRGASINEVVRWLREATHRSGATRAPETQPVRPLHAVRVAPRDGGERMVAAVWEEVLNRSGFGVTQSFAELGGDLAAVNRAAELLSRRSGRRLLVQELVANPTIERQAALLREPERKSRGPRRLLRQGGSSTPLFFFHPGGADTLVYRQLVEQLDPSLTAWGLDRLDGVLSVEERAERYVELLLEADAKRPYRLAGWSFGGALAYETGLRLRAAGEEIELLAMIDTILPLPDPPGVTDAQILELRFQRFAEFLQHSYGKPLSLPYEQMATLGDEEQTDVMIDAIIEAKLIDPGVNAAIIRHQRTSYLDVRALERYRPGRLDGPVVYYSARDTQPGGMRDPRFDRHDIARGWKAVCGAQLDVVTVPGHHLSLLDPPNVDFLAAHLNRLTMQLGRAAA